MKSFITGLLILFSFSVFAEEYFIKTSAKKHQHYREVSAETQGALDQTSDHDYDKQILIYINHFKKVRNEVYGSAPEYRIRGGHTIYSLRDDLDNERLKNILSSGTLSRAEKRAIRNKLRVMRNRMAVIHEKNIISGATLLPFEMSESLLEEGHEDDSTAKVIIGAASSFLSSIQALLTYGPMALYTAIDLHHLIERDKEVYNMLRDAEKEMNASDRYRYSIYPFFESSVERL